MFYTSSSDKRHSTLCCMLYIYIDVCVCYICIMCVSFISIIKINFGKLLKSVFSFDFTTCIVMSLTDLNFSNTWMCCREGVHITSPFPWEVFLRDIYILQTTQKSFVLTSTHELLSDPHDLFTTSEIIETFLDSICIVIWITCSNSQPHTGMWPDAKGLKLLHTSLRIMYKENNVQVLLAINLNDSMNVTMTSSRFLRSKNALLIDRPESLRIVTNHDSIKI